MATKHTLRMLGVSEAEMPHVRHISFSRRLRDWRFLLLSRILQSGRGIGDTRAGEGLIHSSAVIFFFLKPQSPPYLLTLRGLFFPVGQSPLSTAPTSFAPSPGTNPTASAGRASERSPFSSALCRRIVAYAS